MLFSSKEKKDRLELILDIQSSIVRGSLVLFRHGAVPHILWTRNIDIPHRPHGGSAYLIKMAVKAVEDICLAAHTYVRDTHGRDPLPTRITVVHFVLTSPWIVSQARTVSHEFEKDTRITRALIADIIKSERARLSSGDPEGLTSIEEKIFDVCLNGYSISEWEGNVAKNLEVSFAVTLAGTRMIKRFARVAARAGAHEPARFHSSLLLQYAGITTAMPLRDPYILVHAHGELTDLVVVDKRSCVLFGSHPIGVNTVIRAVAKARNISDSVADSLLSMSENESLSADRNTADIRAIVGAAANWVKGCKGLMELVPDNCHPTQAVISSRQHETFFRKAFSEAYPQLKTKVLDADALVPLTTFDPGIESLRLTILYVLAISNMESL
jgi:hypothetical protein